MTPETRRELEKLRRWIRDRWCNGSLTESMHYVQKECASEITRRLNAAKKK